LEGVPDAASRRPVRPLVELRGAPRTTARRTRTAMGFRPTRPAFRRPAGGHPPDLLPTRRSGLGPPCAFVLLQRHVPAAPHRGVTPPGSCEPTEDPSRDAASPGLSRPTTRAGPADPHEWCNGSLRSCVPRAGFGYPLRDLHHRSSRRRSAGAFLGLTLQGVLLVRELCPSRGRCPPDVAGRARPPRGEGTEPAAFRALFPRRVRAATSLPRETGRRYLPGFPLSRAFSPSARAIACSHDAGPLVLGGDDVPTHLDPRASRIEWIGLARFRAACSLEVSHLATVVALRSPSRGAGSWLRLTQDVTHDTRRPLRSKLPRGRCIRGS
jgi:hypothetical protein